MLLRPRPSFFRAVVPPPLTRACVPSRRTLSASAEAGTASPKDAASAPVPAATRKNPRKAGSPPMGIVKTALFLPPGVERDALVPADMVIPGSNIVVGPYAGDARVKGAEFVKSSARARDCPNDDRPEFAVLGRSNVGKSSLINALTRRKEAALTSKKPGKTQTINHFLVNKSWYLVDLPGYGFAAASQSARMDWSSFTKGYFLNRDTLVGVLLLIDASIPPQKIDLDCANWLGRNNIGLTFVFTKCDKVKKGKGGRPDENIKEFHETISGLYPDPPPWIMTSSVTGLGRDGLLLHMSQLRNYWDNEAV
ncbi:GTP-binding protein At2g22870 [Zea mays]|uniref:GTP-binding protein n=2 Tax=Zea mays TaxID=4577 RepID=B4FR01_MAIZE|nr:GTP-binding protein At2g22870 [Zea mays]ACF84544.1 unknown [Zea mays]ACG44448.1 GTP-binding protein [Zea mays]AQL08310.1 GTP-binding protein [Zea mays]|eukprot:NP_001151819.1 GTP-binding protein [Zea mays]